MSLAALAVAAAVAGPAAPAATETPNLYPAPSQDCRDIRRQVVERQREALQRLGRLPRAAAMYAVERRVRGCPVPTPMGYHPDYLLPGQADAPEFRPEFRPVDERWRRR